MKRMALVALAVAAAPALTMAQPNPSAPPRYLPAPWWMDQSVIPSMGHVRIELQANRAEFRADFRVVDDAAQAATQKASAKIRDLTKTLSALGAQKAAVTTTVQVRPIFSQYRDKDGRMIANERSDKIDAYEATATVSVEVQDISVLEKAYGAVMTAGPTDTQPVTFTLEASNEQKSQLFLDAVSDAARRAKAAAQAAGGRLGPVKLIDPSSRACEADALIVGAQRDYDNAGAYLAEMAAPPPPVQPRPPVAVAGEAETAIQLVLQPPMRSMEEAVCVVYALGS